jgi:hypothetical protein
MGHRSANYGRAGAGTVGRIAPFGKPGGSPRSHGAWGANLVIATIQAIAAVSLRRDARMPGVWALPAGSGDVLTALFALPAATAVATGTAQGRKVAIASNIFGRADFAIAITLGFITSPGPLQLIVPDVPRIGAGAYPADPGFRGAKLDPAARAVAAPADPTTRRLISFLSFHLDADNSRRMEGWSYAR